MNNVEVVEELTQIVEKQAIIIRKQHNVITQIGTTSFEDEVESVLAESQRVLNEER